MDQAPPPPPRPPSQRSSVSRKQKDKNVFITFTISKTVFWLFYLPVVVAIGSMVGYYVYRYNSLKVGNGLVSDKIIESIGPNTFLLFRKHDRDGDGKLDLEEFEPIAYILADADVNVTNDYSLVLTKDDQFVTVKAEFSPLDLATMTKDMDTIFAGNMDSLLGLKKWKEVHQEYKNFPVTEFKNFFPEEESKITDVGHLYVIAKHPESDSDTFHGPTLSSNRYYPPVIERRLAILHELLLMFHSNPFIIGRFAPQGSLGCVRAYSQDYVEVILRIHAEFQLNQAPRYPFWYSPSMFIGRIVMTRDFRQLLHVDLTVPNNQKLNVDMEWLNGPSEEEQMEVDIGYMDRMTLYSAHQSVDPVQNGEDMRLNIFESSQPTHEYLHHIKWTKETTREKCLSDMEKKFYPFKQVPYYNFTEVFRRAKETNLLVHLVLMWGALDDQSC